MATAPLPRLYAILDTELALARGLAPLDVLRQWLDAGVRLVQLRAKPLSFGPLLDLAGQAVEECRRSGAIIIVNDRADVARLAGADGVHLGQDDLAPDDARSLWPEAAWVGLSTHNDVQLETGLATAATYLATGPVFATRTKSNPDPIVGIEGVTRAAARLKGTGKPLVAIGGVTLGTAASVLAAGAQSVAVISDLLAGDDIAGRARAFIQTLAET